MLSHGAHLVLTAEDAFNPSADPLYPTNIWPLPGPGMFGALFRKVSALPDEPDEPDEPDGLSTLPGLRMFGWH